jgi:hypothetical protein
MRTRTKYGPIVMAAMSALLMASCVQAEASPTTQAATPRVRAWVLWTTEDASKSAEAIVPYFTDGEDKWVVVRADVVEGEGVMVAVDAASEDSFQVVLGILTGAVGSEPQAVWRVIQHNPRVPHAAHSYVTESELDPELGGLYAEEFDPPGRHMPKSPGANPWG